MLHPHPVGNGAKPGGGVEVVAIDPFKGVLQRIQTASDLPAPAFLLRDFLLRDFMLSPFIMRTLVVPLGTE